MKKVFRSGLTALAGLVLGTAMAFGQGTGLFHVEEERIIDPAGQVFIAHGINYQGPKMSWPANATDVATAATQMADVWNFNIVRLNWRVYDCPSGCLNPCGPGISYAQQSNPPIETYIREFVLDEGMVAMVDNHDYTSDGKVGDCITDPLVTYWTDMAEAFGTQSSRTGRYNATETAVGLTNEQASRIWFDIRNEPLAGQSPTEDRDGNGVADYDDLAADYERLIQAIRSTGAQNIIVLEGSKWGRDYDASSWIKEWGPYFRDKYTNIVFSHHSYGWSDKTALMNYYQWMTDNNLPMVVGEVSGSTETEYNWTRANYGTLGTNWATGGFGTSGGAYEKGIGILFWAYWGGDSADLTTGGNGGAQHITLNSSGVPANLTEQGKLVWADARRGDKTWTAPCGGNGCSTTPNLALNKPATASSSQDEPRNAAKAVDGSPTTRWSSTFSDPQWLYVDLGARKQINRVVLRWETAYATAYKVQTSDNATSWTDVYATTTGNGDVDDLAVTGTGRYVRVYGTARATVYGYSLWELEVYGGDAGDVPWSENFTGLSNGATSDTAEPSRWSSASTSPGTGGYASVQNGRFAIRNTTGTWTSELINIAGGTVNVSLSIEGATAAIMETTDYINVYYKLDGGALTPITQRTDGFAATTVSKTGLSGSTLQIVVEARTSATDETYYIDNVSVSAGAARRGFASPETVAVNSLEVFPNPVTRQSTIRFAAARAGTYTLQVVSLQGGVVYSRPVALEAGLRELPLDLSAYRAGTYVIRMIDQQGQRLVRRVVKLK